MNHSLMTYHKRFEANKEFLSKIKLDAAMLVAESDEIRETTAAREAMKLRDDAVHKLVVVSNQSTASRNHRSESQQSVEDEDDEKGSEKN